MSEVAGVDAVGRRAIPTSGHPTASAAAPPDRKRDHHARPVGDSVVVLQRKDAARVRGSVVDEGGGYVSEWDPRLT